MLVGPDAPPLALQPNLLTALNSQSLAKRVRRAVRAERAPCPKLVIDGVWGELRSVASKWIAGRVWIIRILAQLPSVIPLLVKQTGSVGREGVGRRLVTEWASVHPELIVNAV